MGVGEGAVMGEFRAQAFGDVEYLVAVDLAVDLGESRDQRLCRPQENTLVERRQTRAPNLLRALISEPASVALARALLTCPIRPENLRLAGPLRRRGRDEPPELSADRHGVLPEVLLRHYEVGPWRGSTAVAEAPESIVMSG